MYTFAVVTLFGLVALKITDLLVDLVPGLGRARTLVTFSLAVVVAVGLDYSIFRGFGITVRDAWMGTVGTGLVIGSLAGAWESLLGWFSTTSVSGTRRIGNERPRIAA